MPETFTEKDFTDDAGYLLSPAECVKRANARVDKMIEAAPLLGHFCRTNYTCHHEEGRGIWSAVNNRYHTHTGRLLEIKEVER